MFGSLNKWPRGDPEPMRSAAEKKMSASLEDYLEAIYQISERKHAARAKDISTRLGVNKSSVTGALKALSEKGLINYAPYDLITLTTEGNTLGERIVRGHEVFRNFLVDVLGIELGEAEICACRVEHSLTSEILERLGKFTEFLAQMPQGGEEFLEEFHRYCGPCATGGERPEYRRERDR